MGPSAAGLGGGGPADVAGVGSAFRGVGGASELSVNARAPSVLAPAAAPGGAGSAACGTTALVAVRGPVGVPLGELAICSPRAANTEPGAGVALDTGTTAAAAMGPRFIPPDGAGAATDVPSDGRALHHATTAALAIPKSPAASHGASARRRGAAGAP